jgi:PEP-CTERM motif
LVIYSDFTMRTLTLITLFTASAMPAIARAGQPYLVSQTNVANIWRIEDKNGDGDALDAGERTLWATGSDAFGGMQTVGQAVYAISPDVLAGDGGVVRLMDLNGDGDALDIGENIVWADGFGQPIDIARDAAGSFYVSDDVSGEIWRLVDANNDGDALDVGERTLFADAVYMPFMLLPWAGGLLAADYINDKVVLFSDTNGDGDALDAAEQSTVLSAVAFPSGLHGDGSGGLFVTSINGDTVYHASDNSGDGDFFDVAEVLSYADGVYGAIDGPWNMTDYSVGGFLLADYLGGAVRLVHDMNGDGDALDIGDVVLFADGVGAPVDIVALVEGLLGDYNGNNTIDAADYTVWRDALTAGATSLANDPTPGTVDESDFLYWRDHFGETLGSGAGSGAAAVPEPNSLAMLFVGSILGLAGRRRLVDRSALPAA